MIVDDGQRIDLGPIVDRTGAARRRQVRPQVVLGRAAVDERQVGLHQVQVPVRPGGSPRHLTDIVLGVVRGDDLYRVDASAVDALESGDRLLYVRKASPADTP